jgi:hypothetical protein
MLTVGTSRSEVRSPFDEHLLRRQRDRSSRRNRLRRADVPVKRFSCRADPWFQSHPEAVDRLESVLTKFYFAGEGPEWQAIWDQVRAVLERKTDTPVERCQTLAVVLQGVNGQATAMADRHAVSPHLGTPTRYPAAMSSATPVDNRSPTSTAARPRQKRGRRTCSRKTRRGASRRTSRGCRSFWERASGSKAVPRRPR